MLNNYYYLTKPGIIRGNLITATAGFFLAAQGSVDIGLLIAMLTGTSMVIASGCVLNNYLDISIDKKMPRTKNRALATGSISNQNALIYAFVLGLGGEIILFALTKINLKLLLFDLQTCFKLC